MEESIASHVIRCLDLFRPAIDIPETSYTRTSSPSFLRKFRDEYSRFKVWAGNIGAHRVGTSSLEYRLRDSSHIRVQVIRLLQDLAGLLEDVADIVGGEKTPWECLGADDELHVTGGDESGEDSPETELDQISVDVADVVDNLLRLSVAIRNPAPHDRFVESHSTDTSHYEPFDIQHVRSKFNHIDNELAERLGKAISQRRQYFKYRKAHNLKLSHGLDQHYLGDIEDPPQTIASSLPEHMKQRPDSRQVAPLEEDCSDAGVSETSYATSMANAEQRRIPPMPKEASKGPFECPFCYMIIIVTNRASWKKHVHGDLRPYICLEKNCMTPEREYPRRHLWMHHLRQNHWKIYKCPFGCQETYSTISKCQAHVSTSHEGRGTSSEIDALIKLSAQRLDDKSGVTCPLCDETLTSASKYQRHVGRHQEQLALFALPEVETFDGVDDDEDQSDDTDSVQSGHIPDEQSANPETPLEESKKDTNVGQVTDDMVPATRETEHSSADIDPSFSRTEVEHEPSPVFPWNAGISNDTERPGFVVNKFRDRLRSVLPAASNIGRYYNTDRDSAPLAGSVRQSRRATSPSHAHEQQLAGSDNQQAVETVTKRNRLKYLGHKLRRGLFLNSSSVEATERDHIVVMDPHSKILKKHGHSNQPVRSQSNIDQRVSTTVANLGSDGKISPGHPSRQQDSSGELRVDFKEDALKDSDDVLGREAEVERKEQDNATWGPENSHEDQVAVDSEELLERIRRLGEAERTIEWYQEGYGERLARENITLGQVKESDGFLFANVDSAAAYEETTRAVNKSRARREAAELSTQLPEEADIYGANAGDEGDIVDLNPAGHKPPLGSSLEQGVEEAVERNKHRLGKLSTLEPDSNNQQE